MSQLPRGRQESVRISIGAPGLERDVLPLNIAELAETLTEIIPQGAITDDPHAPLPAQLLRKAHSIREQEHSRRYGAKKISTLHDCWFPALRRTAACKFANGTKTRIAQVSPRFYLSGTLCQFGRDLLRARECDRLGRSPAGFRRR